MVIQVGMTLLSIPSLREFLRASTCYLCVDLFFRYARLEYFIFNLFIVTLTLEFILMAMLLDTVTIFSAEASHTQHNRRSQNIDLFGCHVVSVSIYDFVFFCLVLFFAQSDKPLF